MLKVVSLYTGIGGLDFGFEAAGFDTTVAVESDSSTCHTIRLNRNWPLVECDIHQLRSERLMELAGVKTGETDVLIGGPPCQPFSKSSYWVRGDTLRLDDPRAGTLAAYLRVLRDLQPKAFLIENVSGLAYKGKEEGLNFILDGIEKINETQGTNYKVSWQVINAAKYGVPQIRERIFLVGSREGIKFTFPSPTHCPPNKEQESLDITYETFRNVWDAIGDLPTNPEDPSLMIGGKWGDLLPSIPEGENYLWHTNRGGGSPLFGWRTRYWSFLLKLSKAKPSWTIQAKPGSAIGPTHWNNRKLSVKELCRLQTFPEGLVFDCSRSVAQRMLGNAVPSLLSEVLAREIRVQLLGDRCDLGPLKLLPPIREPLPEPEVPAPLPRKYKHLIGNHPDHPGKGQPLREKAQPLAIT